MRHSASEFELVFRCQRKKLRRIAHLRRRIFCGDVKVHFVEIRWCKSRGSNIDRQEKELESIRAVFQYEPDETRESLQAMIRRFERKISLPTASVATSKERRILPNILWLSLGIL